MNTKKKRFAPKKRLIKHFFTLTLAGSLLLPGLVLIRCETVEANILADMAGGVIGKLRYNATIAEIIVSILAGSGAGVTNTSYLNQLNSSYGINGSLAAATGTDGTIGAMADVGLFEIANDGTFIDHGLISAIESQPAYTNCNVNDILGTWNDAGTVNEVSAAQNIGESIGIGAAVGSICQVAGAFLFGFNLGKVADNFVRTYQNKMRINAAINTTVNSDNVSLRSGHLLAWAITVKGSYSATLTYSVPNSCYPFFCKIGNSEYIIGAYNPSSNSIVTYYSSITVSGSANPNLPNPTTANSIAASKFERATYRDGTRIQSGGFNYREFPNYASYEAWANSFASNENLANLSNSNCSPDVIGRAGNQRVDNYADSDDPTSWPYLNPSIPEGQGIKPIPWSDYTDWVDTANTNTTNNNTTINQGDTYNNFIENYYVTPTQVPDVQTPDYNPTVPQQPVPNPKEELTSEVSQENTDYMTTPGLQDVFPFSIPWDIAGLFNVFSTNNREAPVITFPIKSELFGIDEEITLDFSVYEDVAAILRLLELIAFGLGLAFVTRYLIGAGGG